MIPICEEVLGLAHKVIDDVGDLLDDSQGA
jgi:hypothetical protein